ncbi:FYVE-type zinc finger-containing protein [Neofusicoccum parvum]|uniref:FYVE-type zinc finger-containing protein n=1 Tax=Neofusicoccum parvum TaxID=310453 RepID=A0ACB5RX51_9PEZI|nr:FYVE-type zinc finger-containing protein [Neofusicoccum parvum]
MATGIPTATNIMPSAFQQQQYPYRGGVQYNPYSPTNSGTATPTNVSPTQIPHHLAVHTRQLRPPKCPMYVPAALRPTERPQRSSPPKGSDPMSPVERTSTSFARRGTADSFGSTYSEIQRIASDEGSAIGPVTGPPSRNHWKSNEDTEKCNANGCGRPFTMFCRRHHCRRCGDIFCYEHSSHEIKLDQDALFHPSGTQSRACDNCWSAYRQWEAARKSRTNSASSQGSSSTADGLAQTRAEPQGLQLPQPRGVAQAHAQAHKVGSYVGSVPRDWNWSTF